MIDLKELNWIDFSHNNGYFTAIPQNYPCPAASSKEGYVESLVELRKRSDEVIQFWLEVRNKLDKILDNQD